MSNPLETQVDGDHYKSLKIQPVEFIHANGLGFMEGAVVKYVSRHKAKNGAQDLRKAIHFLELLLQLEYEESREEAASTPQAVRLELAGHTLYRCGKCDETWLGGNNEKCCWLCRSTHLGRTLYRG